MRGDSHLSRLISILAAAGISFESDTTELGQPVVRVKYTTKPGVIFNEEKAFVDFFFCDKGKLHEVKV